MGLVIETTSGHSRQGCGTATDSAGDSDFMALIIRQWFSPEYSDSKVCDLESR